MGEGTASGEDADTDTHPPSDDTEFAGFGDMGRRAEQDTQNDGKWIIKTINLLEQEAEEQYMTEIASAELTFQKLLNKLETAREDFTDAEVSY